VLRKLLRKYSLESVISLAGALQLIPENLGHAVRLEMLALVAATTRNGSAKPAPADLTQTLLRDSWLAEMARYEEPPPGPFVETITFHGGGYRVFSGPQTESTYTLRSFLEIFTRERLARDYSSFAVNLLTAALSISDLVAKRAGLASTVVAAEIEHDLLLPDGATLGRLRSSVSFSVQEFESYLTSRSLSLRALIPLIVGIGNVPNVVEVERNPLHLTPIVQAKGRFVVAVPSALHTAAIYHALMAADSRGLGERVGQCLLDLAWRTVIDAALRMNWGPTVLTPPSPLKIPNSREAVFAFDTDKLAYILLICDPLYSYAMSPSDSSIDNAVLTSRLIEVERWIAELQPTQSDLQILIVLAGVGRSCEISPDISNLCYSSVLVVSAADLETMSLLERDPLGLWKFQRAAKAFRATTQVGPAVYGPLNEFWYYLKREHSYYFSEEAAPDFIMFDGAAAGLARQEIASNEDRHAVVGPSHTTIEEVTRCEKGRPIYARRERNVLREFCVCTPTIPIWIASADERDASGQRLGEGPIEDDGTIHLVCRAAAFWVAELLERTGPLIRTCTEHDRLLVRISFENLDVWATRPQEEPRGVLVRTEVDRAHGSIQLTFTSAFAWAAAFDDNRAERALVSEYLRGLHELVSTNHGDKPDLRQVEAIVNEVAPLGFKKQLTLTASADRPQLDPRALPDLRLVQRADEQFLMDTLGRRVIDSMALPTGTLEPNVAHDVLHCTVAELYDELQRIIATLCPVGLIESLLAANEAIIRKESEKTTALAPRIACAESSEEMLKEVLDESTSSAKAAISIRFLIEYVTARPPTGLRKLSGSVMDEFLAMASMLVFLGTASDVAEFKIGSVRVAALASRRIHVDPAEFNAAMQSYLAIATGRDVDEARGERQRSRVPDIANQLKAVIESEYGINSEHARSIIGALYEIGGEQHPSVVTFARSEIEQRVADRVGLTVAQVRSMLEKLVLSPRSDFLKPPKPYEKHDVYPWRFGRGLSLLQRPLVLRIWGGVERLSWGQRQLWSSWQHIAYRLAHGSSRAPSPATKQLLNAINDARGYVFEEEVAETLRQRPELAVHERVTKLGGRRIHVGDIDVLVAARDSKRLWLLECKDLSSAATPWSIKHQIEALFVDRPNEKAIQTKHEARLAWAREHIPELLKLVGEGGDGWEVKGAIVTAVELVAPLLAAARMPVISWHELADFDL
jgi:hypothetical protein